MESKRDFTLYAEEPLSVSRSTGGRSPLAGSCAPPPAPLDTHLALTCAGGARLTRAHTYPMAPSIARRQAQMSVWRLRLEYACAEMLVAGEPISVRVAFQRAQIPPSVRRRIAWAPLVRVADDYAALVEARGAISFRVPNVIRGPHAPMLSAVEQVPTA